MNRKIQKERRKELRSIAIEIDGNVHHNIMRQAYDQRREEYLLSKGIKVIRFSNDEVKNNIDEVIRRILFVCVLSDWE